MTCLEEELKQQGEVIRLLKKRRSRNSSNWRYRIIKGYKHRAQKFHRKATTKEEKVAWLKIVDWFDSILNKERFLTSHGAIGIPTSETDFIHRKEVDKILAKELRVRTEKILVLLDSFPYAQTASQMESWIRRIKREVLAKLVMDSGMKETLEIMKDKKLIKKIREVRKKGSKSSPYKPLGVGDKK